jgi:molybdopterin synthase catalytic subunit
VSVKRITGLREPPLPVEEVLAEIVGPSAGGTVVFLGTVRDHSEELADVERLEYTAYGEMAEKVLAEIADEVAERWPQLTGLALLHAVGDLPVGAHTVLVACAAPHRGEAYEASRHALEELKRRTPIWKREVAPGAARWVGFDLPPE